MYLVGDSVFFFSKSLHRFDEISIAFFTLGYQFPVRLKICVYRLVFRSVLYWCLCDTVLLYASFDFSQPVVLDFQ